MQARLDTHRMDPEMKKLLETIVENTQENNVLLKKMHRSILWGRFFKIAYWVVLLALAMGAFYIIQPYVEAIGNLTVAGTNGGGIIEFFKNFR